MNNNIDYYKLSKKTLDKCTIMELEWLRFVMESLPEDLEVKWGVNDFRESYEHIIGQLTERQVDVNHTHIASLYGKCFISPSRGKIIHIIGPNKDEDDLTMWEYEMYIKEHDYKADIDYWKPEYDYEKDGYAYNYPDECMFFNDKHGNLYWDDSGEIEQWEEFPAEKFKFIKIGNLNI